MSANIELGIFDLSGVIMLILAGTSFVYLFRVRTTSSASRMLFWFFLCVILSSIATIVTNIGTAWDWAFAPSQDAFLILGGLFLVRFAYLYPENDQAGEARWATIIITILALVALTYAGSFAIRYISNLPDDLAENQAFYLLTPLAILFAVSVFLRRAAHFESQTDYSTSVTGRAASQFFKYIVHPTNRSAIALRNYGLALAISLVPVIVIIFQSLLPGALATFIFNFGAVIAVATFMLTYLTYAPEPVTLSAKLVGLSLVSILLILGFAGVWIYDTTPGIDEHRLVSNFIILTVFSSLAILFVFPYFFRFVIIDPLDRLLKGVKRANDGDLLTEVEVQYDDEIGFLTDSFNRMIDSLHEASLAAQNRALDLEAEVNERTIDLLQANVKLEKENKDRQAAEEAVNRQLRYQKALAGCSQTLLLEVNVNRSSLDVLNQALEHLRSGAGASRAYILRNSEDPNLGLCTGILAEVCVPEIQPHIINPDNQKFPLSRFPTDMVSELAAGRPYGGPVHQVLSSKPVLMEAFLNQRNPLLSFELFPIFDRDRWWGSVGFDDCEEARAWQEQEVVILRTAAEMIGNTVQRWQAEEDLYETLDRLEERVKERTIEIAQANAELRDEIQERKRFQGELEDRLEIERTLANISVRLLSPMDLIPVIQKTLEDVGRIVGADRVVFIQLSHRLDNTVAELIEWHAPDIPPIHENLARYLDTTYPWFRHHFEGSKSIYVQDVSNIPDSSPSDKEILNAGGINSLLLIPVFMDGSLAGVIACSNPHLPKFKSSENIHTTEVIASMLSSLLYREVLLNTLEEKVAERTRELSAFFDMAILAGEAQELSDIMQSALVKIMEISASEAAVIHLYDKDQHVMRMSAQRGLPRAVLAQLQTIRLDESTMSWMKDGEDDILLPNAALLPAAFEIPPFLSASHIALRARSNIQGLLSCYRLSDKAFSHYQEVFLNAICEQLGMAVENHRLRLKAGEIATIQERQRLARELHDAVSQSIYSLTLFARSGRDALDAHDQAKLQDSLMQIETISQTALKEMRLLLYQLRSLALTEGGLVQAIESRFGLVERKLGIQASIHIDESLEFDTEAEQELFRLLTEALNNVLKHAAASQVSVDMLAENDHVALLVSDNGSGFDPAGVFDGMGLQNIRDRVSALGGRMEISSQPELGTRLRVELPRLAVIPREGESDGTNSFAGGR